MTDESETFLSRWSKRKSQARSGATGVEPGSEAELSQETGALNAEDEEIALEDLPPIESIDASTDLSPWLRKRVPDAWRQAALKRVWTSDPAISQFIGLAENSWDWNAPDGVPGFGPLSPNHDVAQLLARVIGQVPEGDTPEMAKTAATPEDFERPEPSGDITAEPQLPGAVATASPEHSNAIADLQPAACDDEAAALTEQQPPKRRRGGGALPL
jgi:hypothetical protein